MDNPLVQPEPGLFIWTIVTFLGLLWALETFAWGPLLPRSRPVGRDPQVARRCGAGEAGAGTAEPESAQIIQKARLDADAIIAQSRVDGDRLREELRQKARGEADHIVKNAERQIQLETSRALRAAAPRGRGSLGDDRVEDFAAKRLEGGQRAADCGGAPAGGQAPLTPGRDSFRHAKSRRSSTGNSHADPHVTRRRRARRHGRHESSFPSPAIGQPIERNRVRRRGVDRRLLYRAFAPQPHAARRRSAAPPASCVRLATTNTGRAEVENRREERAVCRLRRGDRLRGEQ